MRQTILLLLTFFSFPIASCAASTRIAYSSLFGGPLSDDIKAMTVDPKGDIYVLATAGARLPSTYIISEGGDETILAKVSADGQTILYSTLIGTFLGTGITVDAQGNAYLVGLARGEFNFTTNTVAQPKHGGGNGDVAIFKLDSHGTNVVYATYLGGNNDDIARSIAVDATGNAYVAGFTRSTNFPVAPNAAQTARGGREDAFVAKLNASGSAFAWATYLGGTNIETGNGLAVDNKGRAYVTDITKSTKFAVGPAPTSFGLPDASESEDNRGDAYVARLNAGGSALEYLAYVRGSDVDFGVSVVVGRDSRAVVLGSTSSADFGIAPQNVGQPWRGWSDFFVARLSADGKGLDFSTCLGGSGFEGFQGGLFSELAPERQPGIGSRGEHLHRRIFTRRLVREK